MHIILADDQPRVCSAIRLLLEQQTEAYSVEEVNSAQELLDHLRNCCPDVLLLDWELLSPAPEKILSALHTLCPDFFTIVLDSEPQTKRAALEAGANEFVSKNDPAERLLAAIKSFGNSNKREK